MLVVIYHENIHNLASLRFLKLNLESQNIKMGRRTYEHLFVSATYGSRDFEIGFAKF